MNLEVLISQIQSLDGSLKHEAHKAVNRLLTIRNWLIGYYIVEYEQKGEDRAKYGDNLLQNLSDRINQEGFSYRNFKLFRQFFIAYPLIHQAASDELKKIPFQIGQTVSAQFENNHIQLSLIGQTASAQSITIDNQLIAIRQKTSLTNSHY